MKVLIYGLGSIAQKHITAMRSLWGDSIEIAAFRSGHGQGNIEGVKNVYSEIEVDFVPDFILISNPTALRLVTIKRALEFNCPLFIEKPVLADFEDADELVNTIEANNITTYVACNLRFHPCLQYLNNRLPDIGKVDEVNIYCGSYLPDWRPGTDFRKGYSANAEMGGGVHLDLYHELDYCYWFFGFPVGVQSYTSSRSHLDISAIDYAHYLFAYDGFAANITLNYFRKERKRYIELLTANGTWTADLVLNKVFLGNTEMASFPEFDIMDTYVDQVVYFTNCIKEGKQPMNSFKNSLKVLELIVNDKSNK